MEGALSRRTPTSLTRRRQSRVRRPGAMGMRQRCRIRRGARQRASEATSRARRAVEKTATGRCSAEEPSIGAPPGPRSTPHAPFGDRVMVVAKTEAGGSPSSEAPPGRLIRQSGSTSSQLGGRPGHDGGRPPTVRPRVSRRTRVAGRRKTERGANHDATRNRTVRRVLVKGVGCRSRRDASFS
jgi:hypothetical protein